VVTLATIDSSGPPVQRCPATLGTASALSVVLAIDSCLSVFSPPDSCAEVTPLEFPHHIDTFAVSPCSRFLLAGLADGSMQFVSLGAEGGPRLLTGQPLAGPAAGGGATFAASTFSGAPAAAQMSLVTTTGTVFLFTGVQLDRFHSALAAGDLAGLRAAQGEIERSVVEPGGGAVTAALALPDGRLLLAAEHGVLWSGGGPADLLPSEALGGHRLARLAGSRADPSCLFCLDSAGRLHLLCAITLVRCLTWQPPAGIVEDFVLLEDEGSAETKLLVLLREPGLKAEERTLQIVAFPSFTVSYRLTVSWCGRDTGTIMMLVNMTLMIMLMYSVDREQMSWERRVVDNNLNGSNVVFVSR
jgi:hypothetical protein